MPFEIERKFLVIGEAWRALGPATRIIQGYLPGDPSRGVIRVRIAGQAAWLTIKGKREAGKCLEFEYPIPASDAEVILAQLCARPFIEKTRTRIPLGKVVWEVDEFAGENQGLVVAEVELETRDTPVFLPPWIGREVTDEPGFSNTSLMKNPFARWPSPLNLAR